MNSTKRILTVLLACALIFITGVTAFAANTGTAVIGFSSSGIEYLPMGISGVESNLSLSFGQHVIGTSSPVQTYQSVNKAGYVVENRSGGNYGYKVTLGLSAFDRGLEGASLTLRTDSQGVVSDAPHAGSPPILFGGADSVTLEADSLSSQLILEGKRHSADPSHTALGRWGANFEGGLHVYSDTILAGTSRATMTWDLIIA